MTNIPCKKGGKQQTLKMQLLYLTYEEYELPLSISSIRDLQDVCCGSFVNYGDLLCDFCRASVCRIAYRSCAGIGWVVEDLHRLILICNLISQKNRKARNRTSIRIRSRAFLPCGIPLCVILFFSLLRFSFHSLPCDFSPAAAPRFFSDRLTPRPRTPHT